MAATDGAVQRVLAVLPELYAITPLSEFPARMLTVAQRLVHCDKGDYTEIDTATGNFRVLVLPEPSQLRQLTEARRHYMAEHPLLRHFTRVDDTRALQISDFLRPAQFHRLGLYGEFFRLLGVEAQMTIAFSSALTGTRTGISLDRGRPGFGDDDRLALDLFRPHVKAAHDNAARFSRALAAGAETDADPAPASASLDRLTERQREILALVSAGHTNAAIATTLDLSVGTVRKHLDNIRERLHVPTRTAAAVCYASQRPRHTSPARWTATVDHLAR